MQDTSKIWSGVSPVEVVALVVFALIVLAVAWTAYQKLSGRARSDVSGLHLKHNGHSRQP
ncbi:MAG TPA: hypothetical protein VFJ82_08510 [Longimicrobium sp.]|nr:hypothetical protein [Longimicrobium sp.]